MVKLLFLPHCLKKNLVKEIDEFVANFKNGEVYEVYDNIKGFSVIKEIINEMENRKVKIERIVGVACKENLELARNYLNKIGYDQNNVGYVQLATEGCKKTEVNLADVYSAL